MQKIVLGTAQFGMDYGINNFRGKIPQAEAFQILKEAGECGIDTIDTAYAYGVSERLLGDFIKSERLKFKLISKLPKCTCLEVEKIISGSLSRLNLPSLYGYLVHSLEDYKLDKGVWQELERQKQQGRVEKIGFSLYFPFELEAIIKSGLQIDMVQFPFNVFDRRFEPNLNELKKRKIEIYARSVFLQGLFFKKPQDLEGDFKKAKEKIKHLNLLAEESRIPIFALCLGFVLKHELMERVIVGVDSIENFREIAKIRDFIPQLNDDIMRRLGELQIKDEKIILPVNWGLPKVRSLCKG